MNVEKIKYCIHRACLFNHSQYVSTDKDIPKSEYHINFLRSNQGGLYIVLHLTFTDVMQRMCKNTIRIKSHKRYHYWK